MKQHKSDIIAVSIFILIISITINSKMNKDESVDEENIHDFNQYETSEKNVNSLETSEDDTSDDLYISENKDNLYGSESKELNEIEIYTYMQDTFNTLTNYGETYEPDTHDEMIALLASKKFNISAEQANEIYIRHVLK